VPEIVSPFATWAYSWISPGQARGLELALEQGDLVAQDEDLGVLGAVGPGEQREQGEHAQDGQVGES